MCVFWLCVTEKNKFKDRTVEETAIPDNITEETECDNLNKEICDEREVKRKYDPNSRDSSPSDDKLAFECVD